MIAAYGGHTRVVTLLKAAGADLTMVDQQQGLTALLVATRNAPRPEHERVQRPSDIVNARDMSSGQATEAMLRAA